MVDFVDPGESQAEQGEEGRWRINDFVGHTLLLIPQSEHEEQTEYGKSRVIDCIGGAWDTREKIFITNGEVRVFQDVLKKKLRPVLAENTGMIAALTKDAAYYDFQPVDPTLKKQVAEAWETLQGEGDSQSSDF